MKYDKKIYCEEIHKPQVELKLNLSPSVMLKTLKIIKVCKNFVKLIYMREQISK